MNLLKIRGFFPYLMVAFLNASVDLAHKITIQNVLLKTYDGTTLVVLTALVNSLILLPFIFLFSPSGFINDKYSHTKVIRYSSLAAVAITLAIFLSYFLGAFVLAFLLTIVLATQSAIYSPAKYSIIKSIVGTENLGRANGVIQALTIVAILLSSFVFSYVFEHFYVTGQSANEALSQMTAIAVLLFVLSIFEAVFAFRLPFFSKNTQNTQMHFVFKDYFRLRYLKENLHLLRQNRNIWLSVIGLAVFWGVSQMIVATFPAHYKWVFQGNNAIVIQGILAVSGVGLILGSAFAGALSKQHIEHGIVPIGALGIFISVLILALTSSPIVMGFASFSFGVFGGMFIVPLNATIQFFARARESGKIMAGNNFIQNVSMFSFLMLSILFISTQLSTRGLLIISSGICLLGSFYAIAQLPHLFARLLLLPILKTSYRFNVEGLKNLPQTGGVLLLGNHISWIDWLVLQAASPRAIKFVMYRGIYNKWYLRWFFKIFKVVPIGAGYSKESIQEIRALLENGEVVALFPEGHISYNGQINEFQRGYEVAIQDLKDVAIVPFYLRGLWGSSFSRADQHYRSLSKQGGKRDILVAFGSPIYEFIDHVAMRQKVIELSFSSWESFINRQAPFTHQWIESAKRNLWKTCAVDSLGLRLNHLKFITAVLVFKRILRKALDKKERHIGVLLPSSTVGAIVNMALFIMGKIPVNLNYTLSEESMAAALKKANIQSIISSDKFIDKLAAKGFDYRALLQDKLLLAEDLAKIVAKPYKIYALLTALFAPVWWIKCRHFHHTHLQDTAVVLFSSGSEGEPKGIELSHKNLLTNILQISDLLNFRKNDVILNSLPIFHSFGLTVTTLLPLCVGVKMVSVPDPIDGALVGKMAALHNATIIFGTSTFFRLYLRNKRLTPLMFQAVRIVVAGAEKLKPDVKEDFKLKFGLDIYEGYGTTETAPVVAVNTPNMLERSSLKELIFNKAGTVGMPLPGTVIKIVDPDSLRELPIGEDGLILIGGGQVMKGYLNDQEKTKEVIVEIDGVRYYKTGDKGHVDAQGFITIVDRYSRFAKIGGEMISLGSVEEQISKVLGERAQIVASNVADAKKGEAVVLLAKSEMSVQSMQEEIKKSGIAPLLQPSAIFLLDEIPMLASGKVDFKRAKALATTLYEEKNHSVR